MVDFFEHIDEYKNNLLTPEDRSRFEEAMKHDLALQAAIDNYDLVKEISLSFLDEEVRDAFENSSIVNDGLKDRSSTKTKKLNKVWIFVLLMVLLMTLSWFGYTAWNKNEVKKTIQYADLIISPAWPISRSESSDTLSDAIKLGLQGDLQPALKMIRKSSLDETTQNLWIAELFAHHRKVDSTLYYLPNESDDVFARDRINYLRILSYFDQGDLSKVKAEITKLPEDTDQVYMDKYKMMLSK